MARIAEVLLAAFALIGICSAIPKSSYQTSTTQVQAEHVVVLADGSEPMPLCRGKSCK